MEVGPLFQARFLFAHKVCSFWANTLQVLRQPIEDGYVRLGASWWHLRLPLSSSLLLQLILVPVVILETEHTLQVFPGKTSTISQKLEVLWSNRQVWCSSSFWIDTQGELWTHISRYAFLLFPVEILPLGEKPVEWKALLAKKQEMMSQLQLLHRFCSRTHLGGRAQRVPAELHGHQDIAHHKKWQKDDVSEAVAYRSRSFGVAMEMGDFIRRWGLSKRAATAQPSTWSDLCNRIEAFCKHPVGNWARRATPYGMAIAEMAGRCAADNNIVVVSEEAGCDYTAGMSALNAMKTASSRLWRWMWRIHHIARSFEAAMRKKRSGYIFR